MDTSRFSRDWCLAPIKILLSGSLIIRSPAPEIIVLTLRSFQRKAPLSDAESALVPPMKINTQFIIIFELDVSLVLARYRSQMRAIRAHGLTNL